MIGVVGQQSADKSPSSSSMPPEKKSKKDKPPSKTKKSESDSKAKKVDPTDSKIASWITSGLSASIGWKPYCYPEHFN